MVAFGCTIASVYFVSVPMKTLISGFIATDVWSIVWIHSLCCHQMCRYLFLKFIRDLLKKTSFWLVYFIHVALYAKGVDNVNSFLQTLGFYYRNTVRKFCFRLMC
ncbi:hypothetical protein NP493_405g00041 [Ridgeia piscesae]|uniref:Uncharacterized protein n=1 Tax=Ridgeia piscesae TaxID=27915 RepID=A0AAD9NSK0_RIDPI|nr:hypothetical protein NP493_405g00041 [Ridgeia piscesae]